MILALSGKARSGKDTVANYLHNKYHFTVLHFSDALYEECGKLYKFIKIKNDKTVLLHTNMEIDRPDFLTDELITKGMTTKNPLLLQWWGTVRREYFSSNYWIDIVKSKLKYITTNVVIADVRLLNEYEFMKLVGAKTIRIFRLVYDEDKGDWVTYVLGDRDPNHPSETELDHVKDFDGVVFNIDDVDFLIRSFDEVFYKLNSNKER